MGGRNHHTGCLVENQPARMVLVAPGEIEHALERSRDRVERAARLDPLAEQPVVLDEAQDRALVDQGVVDMVALRKGRDDEQRQTRAVAATTPRGQPESSLERRRRGARLLEPTI